MLENLEDKNKSIKSIYRAQNLVSYALSLIEKLLLDLWNIRDIYIVLNCIRGISTIKDSYESFNENHNNYKKDILNYNVFHKLISQPFYHSRTLLGISVIPGILDIAFGIDEELENFDISLEKIGHDNTKINLKEEIFNSNSSHKKNITREYNFKLISKKDKKNNYLFKINNKKKGGQFGGLITVNSGKTSKSFYVKTYYGYPAKANLNSEGAVNASSSFKSSSDIIDDSYPQAEYSQVDFKELFVYKVLELIELGPKTHFMVNPYLKDGVLIVTENLNNTDNIFIEMSKTIGPDFIGIQSKLNDIRLGNYKDKEYQAYNILIDLLEIDVINRIFTLNDFNIDNFGYLMKKEEYDNMEIETLTEKWLLNHYDFKIIDFIASLRKYDKYIEQDIINTFLEGNSITKYSITSLMYIAINRTIEEGKIKANKIKKIKEKNRQEKLDLGKKVIEQLGKRFKNNLKNILLNSKQEIVNFITKNEKIIVLTEKYIKEGFDDIDNYINGIVINYETLKNYIMNN